MRYLKLTPKQRRIKQWRDRRNATVSEILASDPYITRAEALKQANKRLRADRSGAFSHARPA